MSETVIYRSCDFLQDPKPSEYRTQAESVLAKHGIRLTISYLKTDTYFDDEGIRNIFRWTLSKGSTRVWGTFGDSIRDTEHNECPTAYDILAAITKYPVNDFADFCSEYGYDTDSRKAEKTFRAVRSEWNKVARIFTTQASLDDLREIA